ncbi:MAG: RNase adapter RapZ [Myxococcales bacterium]|jgi:UPF0042 nucleotide-binding protein|nr:RNase adapter RapZ [Myxococcales bacterium]
MSGAGKSTTTRALEDLGFFCIDNLPVVLLPKMTELATAAGNEIRRLAIVIDAREGRFLSEAPDYIAELRKAGHHIEVLFLETSDDALIRRFSETRRRHPLAGKGSVVEGIHRERLLLNDLRHLADQLIDTSGLTVHELKALIQSRFSTAQSAGPNLTIMSFGFRYGIPSQADLVFDVRFLPNPYFIPELRPFTGRDPRVAGYVLERDETQLLLKKIVDLCEFLLPLYQRERKAYLTIAIGCTGGKHRSVAITHELSRRLSASHSVHAHDRDAEKE